MKVGFSRIEITPPMGLEIPGYFNKRPADGILDPLFASCVAFDDGEKKALVINLDAIGCTQPKCEIVHALINEKLGIDKEAIYICATHSHTAFRFSTETSDEIANKFNKELEERLVELAKVALDDLTEVTAFLADSKDVDDVAFIRKYLLKDGTFNGHPGYASPLILKNVGIQDKSVQFLRILRENAKEILLINFGTHADCIGGTKYSADWAGALVKKAEAALDVYAVSLVGCQGNSNTSDKMNPVPPRKKEHTYGYYTHKMVANKLLAAVLDKYENAKEIEIGKIAYAHRNLEIGCSEYSKEDIPIAKEMEKIYSVTPVTGWKSPLFADYPFTHVKARKILRMEKRNGEPYNLMMSALSIGGLCFCGISGEPYCEIGIDIKNSSQFDMTMVTCQTNGNNGYLPDAFSMQIACYESDSSNFEIHVAEKIANMHADLLRELFAKTHD